MRRSLNGYSGRVQSPQVPSFVFQAEDGIRDRNVTGVQTCALPIYTSINFSTSFFPVYACIELGRTAEILGSTAKKRAPHHNRSSLLRIIYTKSQASGGI